MLRQEYLCLLVHVDSALLCVYNVKLYFSVLFMLVIAFAHIYYLGILLAKLASMTIYWQVSRPGCGCNTLAGQIEKISRPTQHKIGTKKSLQEK